MNATMMRIVAMAFVLGAAILDVDSAQAFELVNATANRSTEDTGSPERFGPDLDRAFKQFNATAPKLFARADAPIEIHLVVHVLSGPTGEGNLDDATIAAQMSVLNEAYRPSGLHFGTPEIRRYPNSAYFAGACYPTTTEGLRMKEELAVTPARFVNVYTCQLPVQYIAGVSTLPDQYPENDPQHGVVVDYRTFPGSAPPLDLGHTLVHELGHYFGLLHPFQGGCTEPGDGVDDTPAEASAASGCMVGRDSCAQPGLDPVTNYMDYSADTCTDNFTPLQTARMHALIATYRPTLLAAPFAIGPGMTGNWYDPHQSGHGFSLEVQPDGRLLAEWFTFAPQGGPTWILAIGPINGDTAVLDASQAVGPGGLFPPNFDPTQIHNQPWGTLTFRFTDCTSGEVSWQPTAAGYAAGSMSIKRLTLPAGLSCP